MSPVLLCVWAYVQMFRVSSRLVLVDLVGSRVSFGFIICFVLDEMLLQLQLGFLIFCILWKSM